MRIARIFFVAVFVLGLSLSGFSQERPSPAGSANPAVPVTPTTGKLFVTFTITFVSGIPSTDLIACNVTATVQDATMLFSETAIRAATRNGSTATCLVFIPYSWALQNPGSDFISLDYSVNVGGSGSTPYPYRESSQFGYMMPVPSSGTVTNLMSNFTL